MSELYTERQLRKAAGTTYDVHYIKPNISGGINDVCGVRLVTYVPRNRKLFGETMEPSAFLNNRYSAKLAMVEGMREQVETTTPLFPVQQILYGLAGKIMNPRTLARIFKGPSLADGLDYSLKILQRVGREVSAIAYPPATSDITHLFLSSNQV